MALMKVVAVRDSAMNAFATPAFVPSLGVAIRSFADEAAREGSPVKAHPDDYELFELGDYDETTGYVNCLDTPRQIARGVDFSFGKEK